MRILVADDDPGACRALTVLLRRWGYDVQIARDGAEALAILLRPDAPRLAMLDWGLPGLDGAEVCRAVRSRPDDTYTYLLMLTGRGDRDSVVEGLAAGADEYLVKPVDAQELEARLRIGRRILELQERLLTACAALRERAERDPLTGLFNRAAVLGRLEEELNRAERTGQAVGVVLADLDHFKQVNDTYGHLEGDTVLREAARRFRVAMRPYDAVGRYGGEEFLAVAPGCDEAGLAALSDRLRASISDQPFDLSGGPVAVTVSVGACVGPAGMCDTQLLLRAADEALYRAKAGGRNRVELASPVGNGVG
jgi:two-component system, cell cycle response regulator